MGMVHNMVVMRTHFSVVLLTMPFTLFLKLHHLASGMTPEQKPVHVGLVGCVCVCVCVGGGGGGGGGGGVSVPTITGVLLVHIELPLNTSNLYSFLSNPFRCGNLAFHFGHHSCVRCATGLRRIPAECHSDMDHYNGMY